MNGYPSGNVFYRDLTRAFPKITHAAGCYLYDDQGKRYLDACGGAFVVNVGHGVTEIAEAIGAQAARLSYVNGTAFTTGPTEELAAELASLLPPSLSKLYFLSSGSEAVEAAVKLARQYWVELGKPTKHRVIARSPGYHGNTLLALSASARGHYKKLYQPWLVDVAMIPAPYAYRCSCNGSTECPTCSGAALEQAIVAAGPDTVAAFIAEPIGGSSTGASVPRPDYYQRIRALCDQYDVLFIADEVLTGAGRTGTWLAMEHFGVLPDIVTLGKGISGGYAPLSAVATPVRILDVLAKGSGALKHAQTFSHFPLSCAAGLAAVRYIKAHKLVERAASVGSTLQNRLRSLCNEPGIGDVRGKGMLAGVEIVQDKTSRKPYARRLRIAETLVKHAQEIGLVLWPNVGHADGENGDLVMIAPPFIITEPEIEELVSLLRSALRRTLEAVEEAP